jgi:hypothetical protein
VLAPLPTLRWRQLTSGEFCFQFEDATRETVGFWLTGKTENCRHVGDVLVTQLNELQSIAQIMVACGE